MAIYSGHTTLEKRALNPKRNKPELLLTTRALMCHSSSSMRAGWMGGQVTHDALSEMRLTVGLYSLLTPHRSFSWPSHVEIGIDLLGIWVSPHWVLCLENKRSDGGKARWKPLKVIPDTANIVNKSSTAPQVVREMADISASLKI